MISIQDKSRCSGCHACFLACPQKCIRLVADEEGFLYPQVDQKECSSCNLCEKVCPILNPHSISKETKPLAYAVKNTDEYIRERSSSGGVFTAMAEYIIEQGGLVFGAAFDDDFNVVHIRVDKKEDLEKLRGSKYVQSKIGYTYQEAKEALLSGKPVLFTGTPCQIGGLKAFLKKDYEKLYTQDLICHGVPSPLAWKKYLEYLKNEYITEVKYVSFRNKEKSWKKYSIFIRFENGQELMEPFTENLYMQAFLKNFSLRPSCYDCQFKGVNRVSDITLADFWGIENTLPQMDDDKGTSLVMIHSDKGKELLEMISSKLQRQEVDALLAIHENGSAVYSSPLSPKRKCFIDRLKKKSFEKNVKKCIKPSLYIRIKSLVKRGLQKIKLIMGRK